MNPRDIGSEPAAAQLFEKDRDSIHRPPLPSARDNHGLSRRAQNTRFPDRGLNAARLRKRALSQGNRLARGRNADAALNRQTNPGYALDVRAQVLPPPSVRTAMLLWTEKSSTVVYSAPLSESSPSRSMKANDEFAASERTNSRRERRAPVTIPLTFSARLRRRNSKSFIEVATTQTNAKRSQDRPFDGRELMKRARPQKVRRRKPERQIRLPAEREPVRRRVGRFVECHHTSRPKHDAGDHRTPKQR